MKRILVFSLGPVFKDYVHGGSQKVLREVTIYLGKKGNKVNIYCVEREDNNKIFQLGKNVKVYPTLRFKQTFPSSYKTAPFNLWRIIKTLDEQIKKHDVFYIHDADLNFYELCNKNIPTIISLRDFLYPETLLGAFNFRRDKIIVNSLHTLHSLKYTVGNYLPGLNKRVELVENGINLKLFKKTKPKKILKLINGKIRKQDKIILYPHRPDPLKGIYQSLKLVHQLKFKKGMNNIKLLIPHYVDEKVTNDLDEHYANIKKVAKDLKINKNIIFHKWIPYELMPEYYSIGDLTLSIGNFIESFGSNVGLESLACQTPVIMSLVGGQRYTLPEGIVPKVAYNDGKKIVEIAHKILTHPDSFNSMKMKKFMENNFSHENMLRKYEEIITTTKVTKPLVIKFIKSNAKNVKLIISPWACLTNFGIYCDYEYKYYRISEDLTNFLKNNTRISLSKIKNSKIKKEILDLIDKGILVVER